MVAQFMAGLATGVVVGGGAMAVVMGFMAQSALRKQCDVIETLEAEIERLRPPKFRGCAVCGAVFERSGRQIYCGAACRQAAYRLRRSEGGVPA